ncbi:MAG: hypothetical protein LUO89_05770 [Methanothrix sp.]|nr:hypothetical protein [Methanothrix sp.]
MEHLPAVCPYLLANPAKAINVNRSAAKYPSLPGAPGSQDQSARFTARGSPPEAVARKNISCPRARSPRKPDISEHPTRAPAWGQICSSSTSRTNSRKSWLRWTLVCPRTGASRSCRRSKASLAG